MGIDNILGRIAVQAEAEVSRTTEEAKAQAAELLSQRKQEIDSYAAERLSAAEQDALERINRIKISASLDKRKALLSAKREMIDEVINETITYFSKMPKVKYSEFLAGVAKKTATKGTLYFAESDKDIKDKVQSLLSEQAGIRISDSFTSEIPSGFLLKYDNVVINCSVPAIVDSMKNELEQDIAKVLFGKG